MRFEPNAFSRRVESAFGIKLDCLDRAHYTGGHYLNGQSVRFTSHGRRDNGSR